MRASAWSASCRAADWLARAQMRFRPVALAPGVLLRRRCASFALAMRRALERALDELQRDGVEAVAISEPFGVDRPAARARRGGGRARAAGCTRPAATT